MTKKLHKLFWVFTILSLILLSYIISACITPFAVAFILAYLLQPLLEYSNKTLKINRNLSVCALLVTFLGIFTFILIFLTPLIYHQLTLLIHKIPQYRILLVQNFLPKAKDIMNKINPDIVGKLETIIHNFTNEIFSTTLIIFNNIWNYTITAINITTLILLVPVILYYFMRDWNKMLKAIQHIIPARERKMVTKLFTEIDQLLSAYLRGQMNICLILSCFYSVALSIAGVDFSIILGTLSGFLIILPFIGFFISALSTSIITFLSFGIDKHLLYVALIYLAGQIIESTFLTPKIIGDRIGLHPVWIIFAVLFFGSTLGFIGILFAVPIAGIIKILLSFLLKTYYNSKIYRDNN